MTIKVVGPASDTDPGYYATAVIPSDTVDLPFATTWLYIGSAAGNVQVTMAGSGATVIFTAIPNGFHPIRVTRVWATNTTSTSIVAVWR